MQITSEAIESALRQAQKKLLAHPRVTELRYREDVDSMNEDILIVYAILADEDAEPLPAADALEQIRETIRCSVDKDAFGWVHVRFRSEAEQKAEDRRKVTYAALHRVPPTASNHRLSNQRRPPSRKRA